MNLENLFNNIGKLRELKRKELEDLVKMGEGLLKVKEFHTPEIKNKILKGIQEGKRILADNQ